MGSLKTKINKIKTKALKNKNQNEVLKTFWVSFLSFANRKKAVSKPKVNRIFTKEIKAYKLVNLANSATLMCSK